MAARGCWRPGSGEDVFGTLKNAQSSLSILSSSPVPQNQCPVWASVCRASVTTSGFRVPLFFPVSSLSLALPSTDWAVVF